MRILIITEYNVKENEDEIDATMSDAVNRMREAPNVTGMHVAIKESADAIMTVLTTPLKKDNNEDI